MSAFDNAFSRYLPPQTVTQSQPAENSQKSGISAGYTKNGVTDEKTPKPAASNGCNPVTAENPQTAVDDDIEREAIMSEPDLTPPDFLKR